MNTQHIFVSLVSFSIFTFSIFGCTHSSTIVSSSQKPSINNSSQGPLLHFRPQIGIAGDAHPFFANGKWYIYFLNEGYKSNLVITQDFLNWQEIPIDHTLPNNHNQDLAPYYVLNVFWDKEAQLFRTYHGWKDGEMISHVSKDLINWDFSSSSYDVPPQNRYSVQRDPFVFWNKEENVYWMLMTCEVKNQSKGTNGAICYASSKDLKNWIPRGDLYYPGNIDAPEVPQMFQLGDNWVLTASILKNGVVGGTSYWVSKQPTGPWVGAPLQLDGEDFSAANFGWDGSHIVLIGWIPLTDYAANGEYTWGGSFAFPREVYQLPDKSIGIRLYPGVEEKIRGQILANLSDSNWIIVQGVWSRGTQMIFNGNSGEISLNKRFDRVNIDTSIMVDKDVRSVDLKLMPLTGLGGVIIKVDQIHNQLIVESTDTIPRLFSSLDMSGNLRKIDMHLFIDGDILEVFVNDKYSLVARLPLTMNGMQPALIVEGGQILLDKFDIYQLKTPSEVK